MVKRRLRRGGCVAWRQVARTVVSATPTSAAIWLTDMAVRARSRICCFFVASIGRQAALRMPRAAVVSLASDVGATLAVLDSGATSPAMRRLRKASKGFQLFVSSLLKRTNQLLSKPSPPVLETLAVPSLNLCSPAAGRGTLSLSHPRVKESS